MEAYKNSTCWSLISVNETIVPGLTTTPAEMRLTAALLYLTVQLLSQQLSPCESLRVAAFNIQKFGDDKSKDPTFMGRLTTVYRDAWPYRLCGDISTDAVLFGLIIMAS